MNEETNSQGMTGAQATDAQPLESAEAQAQPTADAQAAPVVQPSAGTVQVAADQGTVQMPAIQGEAPTGAQPVETQPMAVPVSAQPAGTVQVAPIQGTAQPVDGQAAASAQPAAGATTAAPYTPGAPTATPYTPDSAQPTATPYTPGAAQPTDAGQAAATTATAYQATGTAPAVGGPVTGAPQPSPTPALVCGILAIVMCFVPFIGIISGIGLGVAAIILATRYFRSGGTQGTAKAGRICGIVGLVIAGILIILNIIAVVGAFMTIGTYGSMLNNLAESPAIASSSSAYTSSFAEDDALEEEAIEIASDQMQKIKDQDPAVMQQIADMVESTFDEVAYYDYDYVSLEQMGVDPMVIAQKLVTGFEYDSPWYYLYTSGDEADVDFDVTYRSAYDVLDEFYDLMDDADLESFSSEEEAHRHLGQLLMQAVDSVDLEDDGFFEIELELEDGAWKIDDSDWKDNLKYLFGFY